MTKDDPANPYIFREFTRRKRAGVDIYDHAEQAACLAEGRAAYQESLIIEAVTSEVIYYLSVNGYIKIGTAKDLQARLKSYPPGTKVLATEPGTYALETVRLTQFREYHAERREWFHPGPRLMAHIEALQRDAVAEAS